MTNRRVFVAIFWPVLLSPGQPRRHLVRYYRAYSNVARCKRKQLEAKQAHESVDVAPLPAAEEQDRSPDARSLRRRWRGLIKRVYEVDPLVCPRCLAECIRGWWFSGAGPGHPPGSSSPWARA